ncbi:MAG: FAD-dependent oxidoreductase [archaeon]|nr:FAD-dependent oxidoreductase [archaeon]
MEPFRFKSKLLENHNINEETKTLKFSVPENFDFKAGQYVRMAFYKDGKRILRDYSIFSSPKEKGYILTYFKKVKEGYASNYLFNMKIGEEIEMKGPLGDFGVKDFSKDFVFISSGTGFGPFMSIIKDLFNKGLNNQITLIRGYRNEESLPFDEELKKFSKENHFNYYDILSNPLNGNYKLKGYVQDFLVKLIPLGFKGDFYVCGLKEMVSSVSSRLSEMGVSEERIFYEKYD